MRVMKSFILTLFIFLILALSSCNSDKYVGKYYLYLGHTIEYDKYIEFFKNNGKLWFSDSNGKQGECFYNFDNLVKYNVKETITHNTHYGTEKEEHEYTCEARFSDGMMKWKKCYYVGNNELVIRDEKTYYKEGVIPDDALFNLTYYDTLTARTIDLKRTLKIDSLPILEHHPYVFVGWYFDKEYTQKAEIGMKLTKNTVLYSKWDMPSE